MATGHVSTGVVHHSSCPGGAPHGCMLFWQTAGLALSCPVLHSAAICVGMRIAWLPHDDWLPWPRVKQPGGPVLPAGAWHRKPSQPEHFGPDAAHPARGCAQLLAPGGPPVLPHSRVPAQRWGCGDGALPTSAHCAARCVPLLQWKVCGHRTVQGCTMITA